jgi:hypothetical protein
MITKNIEILPMIVEDTETIARIHTQSWQESYKGILEQEYLDSLTYVSRLEFRKKIITNQAQEELHIHSSNKQYRLMRRIFRHAALG